MKLTKHEVLIIEGIECAIADALHITNYKLAMSRPNPRFQITIINIRMGV